MARSIPRAAGDAAGRVAAGAALRVGGKRLTDKIIKTAKDIDARADRAAQQLQQTGRQLNARADSLEQTSEAAYRKTAAQLDAVGRTEMAAAALRDAAAHARIAGRGRVSYDRARAWLVTNAGVSDDQARAMIQMYRRTR